MCQGTKETAQQLGALFLHSIWIQFPAPYQTAHKYPLTPIPVDLALWPPQAPTHIRCTLTRTGTHTHKKFKKEISKNNVSTFAH